MLHARSTSVPRPAGLHARRLSPMIDLYRKNGAPPAPGEGSRPPASSGAGRASSRPLDQPQEAASSRLGGRVHRGSPPSMRLRPPSTVPCCRRGDGGVRSMGGGGMQPRETDFVGSAWDGRGRRDRHPSPTRPTASSLPRGARATGRHGGASMPPRSHSPRTASARRVDRTATGATRPSPSAERHSVTSPRWTKACSYADQCFTRSFVLYCGWTFDRMSRSCTRSGHRGQRAYSGLVAAEGLCTNAVTGYTSCLPSVRLDAKPFQA